VGTVLRHHPDRDNQMSSQLERELKSDIEHLERKAERQVDALVLTQDTIAKFKWRYRKVHDYTLPDGPTNRGRLKIIE